MGPTLFFHDIAWGIGAAAVPGPSPAELEMILEGNMKGVLARRRNIQMIYCEKMGNRDAVHTDTPT
jgi:hypothetical protein